MNDDLREVQKTFRKMKDDQILSIEPSCDEFNTFKFPEEKKKSKRRYADNNEEEECIVRKKSKLSLVNGVTHKKKQDILNGSTLPLECDTASSTKKKKHKKHRESEQFGNIQDVDNVVSLENEVITKKKKKKKRKSLENTNTNSEDVETYKISLEEHSLSSDTSSRKEKKKHKKTEIENVPEDVLKEKTMHHNNIETDNNQDDDNVASLENEVIIKKKKKKKKRKSLEGTNSNSKDMEAHEESTFSNDGNIVSPKKEDKKLKKLSLNKTHIENVSEDVATNIIKEANIIIPRKEDKKLNKLSLNKTHIENVSEDVATNIIKEANSISPRKEDKKLKKLNLNETHIENVSEDVTTNIIKEANSISPTKEDKKSKRLSLKKIDIENVSEDVTRNIIKEANSISPRKEDKKLERLSSRKTDIENVEDVTTNKKHKKKRDNNFESEQSGDSSSKLKEDEGLLKHMEDLYDEYKTKTNLEVDVPFIKTKKKKKKRKTVEDVEETEIVKDKEANLQLHSGNDETSKKKSKRKNQSEQEEANLLQTECKEISNSDNKHEERKKKKKNKKTEKETQDFIKAAGQQTNVQQFEFTNIKTEAEIDDSHHYNENENYVLQEIPTLNEDVIVQKKKKKKHKGEHIPPIKIEEDLTNDRPAPIYDITKVIDANHKSKKKKELESLNENLNKEEYNINIKTEGDEFSRKVFNSDDETSDEGVDEDDRFWGRDELSDNTFKSLKQLNICLPFIPPAIHNIETRMSSMPTKEQLVRFDNLDVKVVKGKYSKAEDDTIRKNWEEFCKNHDIDPDPAPFLNFIHGSSGCKSSLLSTETRRRFVQYLARGLNDRMLWSVYKRFKNLYNKIHKGRFSGNEDKIILDFMEKEKGNQKAFSALAKILTRDRLAIEKRFRWLRKVKLLSSNANSRRISKDKKVEIIKHLLQVTNVQNVEDLKDREILLEEWEQVALRVQRTPHELKTKWKMHLHDRLFLKETDFNDIGKRLVDLIYEDDVDDFRKISFKKYMPHFNSCSNNILYKVFRQLVYFKVPNEYRDNLKDALKYLKNEYFQMNLRPTNMSRIILPHDL